MKNVYDIGGSPNGYGKNIGYNFTQYKKKLIQIDPESKTFHSLRKNFGNYMSNKGYDISFRKYVLGHSNADITDIVYGSKTPKNIVRDMLNQLVYHQIDFTAFQFDFRKGELLQKLVRATREKAIKKII